MNEGKIESIAIQGELLKVKSEGKTLSVPNPDYPTFKRDMMEKGIRVSDDTTTLDDILNSLFNVLFLALFIFALYKALYWYSSTFKIVRHTGVHFSDIAGMDEVKRDMENIVKEMKSPDENRKRVKGIILEGPPGNGKTLFARALAEESGVNFIATKGADFQGAVMGLGAMKVKMLFKKARSKKPCIVFIDEFDSIGEKRNYAGSGIDKENNTSQNASSSSSGGSIKVTTPINKKLEELKEEASFVTVGTKPENGKHKKARADKKARPCKE